MNFEAPGEERQFRRHFYSRQAAVDRLCAATQLVLSALLAHSAEAMQPSLLLWVAQAASGALLALSFLPTHRYAAIRPYAVLAIRLVYHLLCPQLVWHSAKASSERADAGKAAGWTGFLLVWMTWSRWGNQLIYQLGHRLLFTTEALLAPLGLLADVLNNRRLCRLLTQEGPPERRASYTAALRSIGHLLDGSGPEGRAAGIGGRAGGGLLASTLRGLCSPAAATGIGALSSGVPAAGPDGALQPSGMAGASGAEVPMCLCEAVFGLTQLLLSLALPLVLLGTAEARCRTAFAAAQHRQRRRRHRDRAAAASGLLLRPEGAAAGECPPHRGEWWISYDRMRLLALLALIQFRLFLSLPHVDWDWQAWADGSGWLGAVLRGLLGMAGGGGGPLPAAGPAGMDAAGGPHTEL